MNMVLHQLENAFTAEQVSFRAFEYTVQNTKIEVEKTYSITYFIYMKR